jgi:hypothetical protein
MTTPNNKLVRCDYCGEVAKRVTGDALYKLHSYRHLNFYQCRPCNAHVGCHKHSWKPLGSLANEELRKERSRTHQVFDALWKNVGDYTRSQAYAWMADLLGTEKSKTHIGMLTIAQCRTVREAINAQVR